jgi:predicted RecA/RadA family phage recombinase
MTKATYVRPADEIVGTAAANLVSGDVVVGPCGRVGVITALTGYKTGQQYRATASGRFRVTCLSTDTFTATARPIVYWDAANQRATSTSSGNTPMGRPATAKTSGETTVDLLLNDWLVAAT